jgi:hypothetical protein
MTDYKALLEWLTLPLRPRLRAERAERERIRIERHAVKAAREFKRLGLDFIAERKKSYGKAHAKVQKRK